jgi:hypothetical protein
MVPARTSRPSPDRSSAATLAFFQVARSQNYRHALMRKLPDDLEPDAAGARDKRYTGNVSHFSGQGNLLSFSG